MAKRVPIEGVPKDRPTCVWCGRKALMWTDDTRSGPAGTYGPITRRVFTRWRPFYGGLFDRLKCAGAFARAAYAAGYRRKGGPRAD